MEQRIEQALNNVSVIVRQARMTYEEHLQLSQDLQLIKDKLSEDKKEEMSKE